MSSTPQVAYQSALERARAVAAKLSQSATSKRPLDDESSSNPEPKKFSSDPYIGQFPSLNPPSSQTFNPNQTYTSGIISDGEKTLDMMIPGTKVGYIIGKGGDMIRSLQERANVKMTVIQQSNEATNEQKQLRIVGEPSRVDYARELVNSLLTEKELEVVKLRTKGKEQINSEYGSLRHASVEVPVPPQFIGLVIGKQGENIKRIQHETATKVQFDSNKPDGKSNKICTISGTQDAVNRAVDMVREIIDNARNNSRSRHQKDGGEEIRMTVPVNRTGIVIGKGGDTIRAIKQQSGCDIELEKNSKGVFIIRGPPDRIPVAQQLINEKAHGNAGHSNHGEDYQGQGSYSERNQGHASRGGHSGNPGGHQSHQYQPQQQPSHVQTQWNNYYQGGATDASQTCTDPTMQDANKMSWAAYYAAFYAAGGAAPVSQQQQQTMTGGVVSSGNGADASTASTDYSAAWAEYYRAYGMIKEAEMIEQMAKSMKGGESTDKSQTAATTQASVNISQPVAYPGFNYGSYGTVEKQ